MWGEDKTHFYFLVIFINDLMFYACILVIVIAS